MIDIPPSRVGTDHHCGHAQPVAVLVDGRRDDVIVETAPVVPGDEDCCGLPLRALHDRVDEAGDIGCPALTSPVGCSETVPLGTTHETAGRVPALAAVKNAAKDLTFERWEWS